MLCASARAASCDPGRRHRKKQGPALQAALPYVYEMYGLTGHPELARAPGRSQKSGKLLHVTCHTVPSWAPNGGVPAPGAPPRPGAVLLAVLLLVWLLGLPADLKLRSAVAATAYSVCESVFTKLERGRAYTSLAQWWSVLLYGATTPSSCLLQLYAFCYSSLIGVQRVRRSPTLLQHR